MAQDIILNGIVLEDVPALKVPKDGGGYAKFTDVTDTTAAAADVASGKYFYTDAGVKTAGTASGGGGGSAPEWVKNIHNKNYKLSETGWASWTPSTSETNLISSVDADDTYLTDMATYEYIIRTVVDVTLVYGSGATNAARQLRFIGSRRQLVFRTQNSYTDFTNGTDSTTKQMLLAEPYRVFAYNSSGNLTCVENTYGIYWSTYGCNATFTNGNTTTPTITTKIPAIKAKCHASYFSTTNAGLVDSNSSRIKIKSDIYRIQRNSSGAKLCYKDITDIFNTPL